MPKRLTAEFIGTFVLVFGGCGSAVFAAAFPAALPGLFPATWYNLGIGLVGVSLAFGLTVLGCAYAFGHVSGCHLNPAVTLGLCAGKRFAWKEAPLYIVAQLVGGIVASGALLIILKGRPEGYDAVVGGLAANGYGAHSPGHYALPAAFFAEMIFTFIFLCVILGSTSKKAVAGFAGIPIGLTLTLSICRNPGHEPVGQPCPEHGAGGLRRWLGARAAVALLGRTDRRSARGRPAGAVAARGRAGRGSAREGLNRLSCAPTGGGRPGSAMSLRRFVTRTVLLRLVRASCIALALYALLGFVVIPRVARSVAESKLTALLHRQVTIGKVSLNPFTFGVTIDGFAVRDCQGGPFVAFDQLYLDLQAVSVIHGGVILREITLRGPAITIVRETPDTYGFSDLIDQFSGGPPPDPNAKPARYSLNNIRIIGGSVDFIDKPKNATHTVRKLELAVPFVSNLPYDLQSYVQPSFSAVVNGTPLGLQGRTKPFSETREAAFDIELADLSIPTYMEYVPVALRFTVPSGSVDTKVALSFEQPEGRTPVLSVSGHVAVKNLAARDSAGKPVLTLPLLDVTIGKSDVLGGKVVLDAVRLDKPVLRVVRSGDGSVNLAELGPKPDPPSPAASPLAADAKPAAPPVPSPEAKPAAPLVIELAELHLVDGTVHFSDVAPAGPFETTLTGVTIDARHFSTEPGKPVAIDARLRTEAGESVHDTSEVTLVPLRVTTHAELTGIVLKKYAPYYAKSVLLDLDPKWIPSPQLPSTDWFVFCNFPAWYPSASTSLRTS